MMRAVAETIRDEILGKLNKQEVSDDTATDEA
jgi:hypothetical protein